MEDSTLLAAVASSRKAYERVQRHISASDLSPPGKFWWELIVQWYSADPEARAVDRALLAERGEGSLPNPKHKELLLSYWRGLPDVPSAYNVAQCALEVKRRNAELEYAAAVAENAPLEKRQKLFNAVSEWLSRTTLESRELDEANDDATMLSTTACRNRIALAPTLLTERTAGGAVPGDHIVLFGRPEAGKSLFAVNMAAGFLRSGHKVLYIGNEENVYKTRQRILCSLIGGTAAQIEARPQEALDLARKRGYGLLDTRQGHPGSVPQIAEIVEATRPAVVVLDQIRNLETGGLERASMTHRLEHVAIEVRNMLAKYKVIGVSVSQAGDKTERHGQEPPAWLTMSDVDSSRTGLPAQADLLLGIGADSNMRSRNERAISICKNKLSHTHDGFVVTVDLLRSRVR